jgi:hypothetical protein
MSGGRAHFRREVGWLSRAVQARIGWLSRAVFAGIGRKTREEEKKVRG